MEQKELKNYYESLKAYFKNGCKLHPGLDPIIGEVGYEEHMHDQFLQTGIASGDTISVHHVLMDSTLIESQGILLTLDAGRIRILTKGKRVWKSRKNLMEICLRDILSVSLLSKSSPTFDITAADPQRVPASGNKSESLERAEQTPESKYIEHFRRYMAAQYPNMDVASQPILWLKFDFFWGYANGTIADVKLTLFKQGGSSYQIPDCCFCSLYPNQSYYSVCRKGEQKSNIGGVYQIFDSMDELRKIRLVVCDWKVHVDGSTHHFLTAVRPDFIEVSGNIYNISCASTDMQQYEKSLHEYSVFSGGIEAEYDAAWVVLPLSPGYTKLPIYEGYIAARERFYLPMQFWIHLGKFEKAELLECSKDICSCEYAFCG